MLATNSRHLARRRRPGPCRLPGWRSRRPAAAWPKRSMVAGPLAGSRLARLLNWTRPAFGEGIISRRICSWFSRKGSSARSQTSYCSSSLLVLRDRLAADQHVERRGDGLHGDAQVGGPLAVDLHPQLGLPQREAGVDVDVRRPSLETLLLHPAHDLARSIPAACPGPGRGG